MTELEFGQDWLAQAHPLQAFELAKRAVERPVEVPSVTEQAIQCRRLGNGKPQGFELPTLGLDRGQQL